MIGVVLVTHGLLAQEFLTALEHVVGKQQNFTTISDLLPWIFSIEKNSSILLYELTSAA